MVLVVYHSSQTYLGMPAYRRFHGIGRLVSRSGSTGKIGCRSHLTPSLCSCFAGFGLLFSVLLSVPDLTLVGASSPGSLLCRVTCLSVVACSCMFKAELTAVPVGTGTGVSFGEHLLSETS